MSFNEIKIMLLDDHAVVREGVSARLENEADMKLIGSFCDSKSLLMALRREPIDVLLLDYELQPGDSDGFNLIRAINVRFPQIAILMMSAHFDTATVGLALRGGARGFIGKQQALQEVIKAIRVVAGGRIYLEQQMAVELASVRAEVVPVSRDTHEKNKIEDLIAIAKLSPKESEVIRCFMSGMSVTDIATKFSRSVKTISRQKQSAIQKLGLKSDQELFKIKYQIDSE